MVFYIFSLLFLFALTAICYIFPAKNGYKKSGQYGSIFFCSLIILTLVVNLDYLVIFIWPIIVVAQIIFILFWIFKIYN